VDGSGNETVRLHEFQCEKYGAQGLLASSAELGWSGVSAALRANGSGVITWNAQPEMEVCVAIRSSNSFVTKSSDGLVDRTIAQQGTVWVSPQGKPGGRVEVSLDISVPLPQVLHILLSSQHFSEESLGIDADPAAPASFRYGHSFQDPLVAEIAFAMVSELRAQTAGGRLLADTLAVSLAARLMQRHTAFSADRDFARLSHQGLDRRRLIRVKEYIAANSEGELTIAQLAKVACLSRFHFARAFKAAVGQAPHQYVSAHRLERAKELLTRGDQSLLDIALALNFSSQANFTRAFRVRTGMTPGQYRRGFTHS
jgi:AraC family transcriptional regulator